MKLRSQSGHLQQHDTPCVQEARIVGVSKLIQCPDSELGIPFPLDYTVLEGRAVKVLYDVTEHDDPCENDCQIMH